MKKINFLPLAMLAILLALGSGFAQPGGPHKGPGPGGRGPGKPGNPRDTTKGPGTPRDTTKGPGAPRDTTKGPFGGPNNGGPGHGPKLPGPIHGRFGLSDSCQKVFLSLISADDTQKLQADRAALEAMAAERTAIFDGLRAARKAGDTAAISAGQANLKALAEKARGIFDEIHTILLANKAVLDEVRSDCGGFGKCDSIRKDDTTHHKGNPGGPSQGALKVAPVIPNPVIAGSSATLNYNVGATAAGTQIQVDITISDPMGNLVKNVFNGLVDAGDHTVSLDLTGIAQGVYIIRVQAAGAVCSQKLIIQ